MSREVELEHLLRWAVAETGPVPVPMGAPGTEPFPLKYPDWAEDARAVLAGAPSMPIAEACEVLEAAGAPGDMLELLARMRDNPGAFSARERAAWRAFMHALDHGQLFWQRVRANDLFVPTALQQLDDLLGGGAFAERSRDPHRRNAPIAPVE